MYYKVFWVNEEKTILKIETVQVMPAWTYVFQAFEEAAKMVDDARNVVLINDPHRDPMPSGGNPIEAMRHILKLLPLNFIALIVISGQQNAFASTLISAVSRLVLGKRIKLVNTMDDALKVADGILTTAEKAERDV